VSNSISVNASGRSAFQVTLTQNATLQAPTGANDMDLIRIRILQNGTGGWTLTLGTGWTFGTDIPILTLDTTANSESYLTGIYNATAGKWRVVSVIGGFI
jgi:hypothetical protein